MSRARSPGGGAEREPVSLRVAVYTDYSYHRIGGEVHAERAFALFLSELSHRLARLVVVGRLDPDPGRARYALGEGIDFVALPYYASLANPLRASRGMAGSLRHWWRALDEVDCVWLLGPHPLAPLFAVIAAARSKTVVLGVRQDFPSYIRSRRPGRRVIQAIGLALEKTYRLLSRRFPVVVVGPELARNYGAASSLLEITVSLVRSEEIAAAEAAKSRSYDGELQLLSVGRLDAEKNPMLLAEILAALRSREPRWRLVVCGEGPMADALATKLEALGVADHAELRGYVPFDRGLLDAYRHSHVLINSSWTEGLPQVLFEAFAAGLPVVASDVGGIREAVGEAVRLVGPGDSAAAASEVSAVADDADLRGRMVAAGERLVRAHTLEAETQRVADFLGRARG